MNTKGKHILDVTCGPRGIWFDKNCKYAIYCDRRKEDHDIETQRGAVKHYHISPDVVCDFTKLPFDDNSFELVVIDPPHAKDISPACITAKEYGYLSDGWEKMIHDGVAECLRVLKPYGTLIFKWSDVHISTRDVIDAIGFEPLFGHRSGKKMNTHWMVFMKGATNA